jgi:hypothetical protein
VRCLLEQTAVHEVEVVLGIVQREVQVHQGSEFRFKDFFLWDRPLLVRELQSGFEPSVERWVGQRRAGGGVGGHRFPSRGSLNLAARRRQTAMERRRLALVTRPWGQGRGRGSGVVREGGERP